MNHFFPWLARRFGHRREAKIFLFPFLRFLESFIFGGRVRESLYASLLGGLYSSQFRREWIYYSDEQPHFFNHRWNAHKLIYNREFLPMSFYRGFLSSEIIKPNDTVLDIGCGDGFFTRAFYSYNCKNIDALDIEPSAIKAAKRQNYNERIQYHLCDVVNDPFPSNEYDVIIWEGAIGHFAKEDLSKVLEKIKNSLSPGGIFVGSEVLGEEGKDHLHFFYKESDFYDLFKSYFDHISIRSVDYPINDGFSRSEAYWRCSSETSDRHASTKWNSDFCTE